MIIATFSIILVAATGRADATTSAAARPKVVLILVDDQG
jgi:hypothetical protein